MGFWLLAWQVTGSLVYRVAASKLYPVISPYADPALAEGDALGAVRVRGGSPQARAHGARLA